MKSGHTVMLWIVLKRQDLCWKWSFVGKLWRRTTYCTLTIFVIKIYFFLICVNLSVETWKMNRFVMVWIFPKFLKFNNTFHNISMQILHTVLKTFPMVQTRRICVTITSFCSWFSWPWCVIQRWYCKKKLNVRCF